jgi:hypothetical protein
VTLRLLWLAVIGAGLPAAASGGTEIGKPVAQILREAEATGIRVIFTDQSVPPGLRVSVDSHASEPVVHLREILRPHRLGLEEVTPGIYVVMQGVETASPPHIAAGDEPLREIEVLASRHTLGSSRTDSFQMQGVDLQKQPANFNDAVRSIRRFPGTAGQDLSSRTFVRGGTPEDNLIVLDGVPLHEPFHLPGMPIDFSAIDSTLITGVEFYSGVLPLEYNGRMGGVTHLHLPEAEELPPARVSLGSLAASALLSGSLSEDSGDWMLFARKGLLGRIVKVTDPPIGHPELLDALGRVRYHFEGGGTLTLAGLAIEDHVSLTNTVRLDDASALRYGWGVYETAGERLQSRTTLLHSSLKTLRQGQVFDVLESHGVLEDSRNFRTTALRQKWTLPLDGGAVHWGGAINNDTAEFATRRLRDYHPDVAGFFGLAPLEDTFVVRNVSARRAEVFGEVSHTLGRHLVVDAGVSWSGARYSTDQSTSELDPRISVRLDATRTTRLRASWGRMTQQWTAAELPVERNQLTFDEPSASTMRIIALEQDFGSWLSARVEAFDKRIAHPRPRLENVFFPYAFLKELRADARVIAPNASQMRGYELYATARFSDRWSAWLSYSRSEAFDLFDDRSTPRAWDQPQSAGLGIAVSGSAWLLSAEAMFHSSWPFTPLETHVLHQGRGAPVDFERSEGATYSGRQGTFLALNLKAARRFEFDLGTLSLAYEVGNATDRTNWCCSDLVFLRSGLDGSVDEMTSRKRWLPLTQYATVTWEFGGRGTR